MTSKQSLSRFIITGLVLFIGIQFSAQSKMGFGLNIGGLYIPSYSLNYSKPLDEKKNLNVSILYGQSKHRFSQGKSIIDTGNPDILVAIKENYLTLEDQQVSLLIGLDRRIKESPFSWGLDFTSGWYKESRILNSTIQEFDSTGNVVFNVFNFINNDPLKDRSRRVSNNLSLGLQANFSMMFNVSERMSGKFFVSILRDYLINLNTELRENGVSRKIESRNFFREPFSRIGCVFYFQKKPVAE